MSTHPTQSLAALLEVHPRGGDVFAASLEDFWGATMGCDALARMAAAAAHTCEDKDLHSFAASYVAAAPARVPLELRVERLADSPTLARRRIRLLNGQRLLYDASASFTSVTAGLSYQGATLDADLPDPEAEPSTAERAAAEGWSEYASGPVEFRRIGASWPWPEAAATETSMHREWVRPREPRAWSSIQRAAATVFLSDFYSHWTASDRLAARFSPGHFSSLDHTVWIHRPLPWNGWWLLKAVSDVGHGGRLFTRRQLFTAEGVLVASAAHEGFYAD